ncbi:ABC transporter permease [Desulfohalovibrio reitneri]|uniref:ABC transporter permease n=1 Tax=Desulfohalovibrio reitneri TaxID=1307759 RepID=UPI0004A6B6D6|nr:MlaE family lipid ABC transporter permease subunit [Desulfohalovibrio reitneri]
MARIDVQREEGKTAARLSGNWTAERARAAEKELRGLKAPSGEAVLDLSAIDDLDMAGAWLVHRAAKRWREAGADVTVQGAADKHAALLRLAGDNDAPCPPEPVQRSYILVLLNTIGLVVCSMVRHVFRQLGFMGLTLACLARTVLKPARLRLTSTVVHMERAGINAVPIVTLLAFLIGVVLAFIGAQQLRRFGAQIYVVNLIEVAVLREMGAMLTAIVVAGRSGSAFTAQIGAMTANEEVAAMRAMGIDPLEALVVPRVLALLITLPLLTFLADMAGVLGGGLMSWAVLDVSPVSFLTRFQASGWLWHFWVGVIKAPFFAMAIALIGCFEGLESKPSAESVGRKTTSSVVQAIFWVIVIDAAFAAFFSLVRV